MLLRSSIQDRNKRKGERQWHYLNHMKEKNRPDQCCTLTAMVSAQSKKKLKRLQKDAGLDVYDQVKKIQPICFENACWAYTVGAAIAIKKDVEEQQTLQQQSERDFQAFCIPGSVADHRKVGLGHGNLGKMLLEEETECFCFLAGHESFRSR